MITPARIAAHIATFTHPVDGSAMAFAARESDVNGGSPDVIFWRSVTGKTGKTSDGGGLPTDGRVRTFGSGQ